MRDYGYLIPANAKRGQLIFNFFRPIDLLVFGIGATISIIWLIFVNMGGTFIVLLACVPLLISTLLVVPIPNYHNTLVALQSIIKYYKGNNKLAIEYVNKALEMNPDDERLKKNKQIFESNIRK